MSSLSAGAGAGESDSDMSESDTAASSFVRSTWNTCDCVCFDVDSTVCVDEGIDVLAAHGGHGAQIAALTAQAMGGSMKFEDALAQRLNIIQPSRTDVSTCLSAQPPVLSPRMALLCAHLQQRTIAVFLVSGGFRQMIRPVADILHIDEAHIIANNLLFNDDGSYHGFCDQEPTARSGGKPAALRQIAHSYGYTNIIMIGDGMTDAEAAPPATCFIAYTGNVTRHAVCAQADWVISDFQQLIDLTSADTYTQRTGTSR